MKIPYRDKALILCAALLLLFNHPIMAISDSDKRILSIPLLYWYLLLVWIVAVVAIYRISRRLFTEEKPHE